MGFFSNLKLLFQAPPAKPSHAPGLYECQICFCTLAQGEKVSVWVGGGRYCRHAWKRLDA